MIYIALLRGINVGGSHVVKMVELKDLFAELGMPNAKTYIQSGNIAFEADGSPAEFKAQIIQGFVTKFGFQPELIIRSRAEIKDLIQALPFSQKDIAAVQEADPDVEHLYVYFFDDPVTQTKLAELLETYQGPDLAEMGPGCIYILAITSIRLSALAIKISKVSQNTTARNWKTINKIYDVMMTIENSI